MNDREQFENSYFYFREALEILVQPPAEQCERMGNYNVAWELKDDVSRGVELLKFESSSRLSEQERRAITELIAALEAVPANSLPSGGQLEDNLAAMNDPAWEPLRRKAANLLEELTGAKERNRRYFRENETSELQQRRRH